MRNDIMLALLLDPFLTFEEAAKEFRAMPTVEKKSEKSDQQSVQVGRPAVLPSFNLRRPISHHRKVAVA